jgi:hypothetical protein
MPNLCVLLDLLLKTSSLPFWVPLDLFAAVLVCFARKSFLACYVLSQGVIDSWTCSCWRTVHSSYLIVANSHSACFFAFLVSSSYADSLNSVCGSCEFESGLILYLINVVFSNHCCSLTVCFYFILGCYYIFVWFGWVRFVRPTFLYHLLF